MEDETMSHGKTLEVKTLDLGVMLEEHTNPAVDQGLLAEVLAATVSPVPVAVTAPKPVVQTPKPKPVQNVKGETFEEKKKRLMKFYASKPTPVVMLTPAKSPPKRVCGVDGCGLPVGRGPGECSLMA